MAAEQYFPEVLSEDEVDSGDISSVDERKSGSDHNLSGDFDCNICLDSVQDPVVTFCGHLFCWPCIYKWLHVYSIATEIHTERPQQCPVCKSEVSQATLIPLYGREQTTNSTRGKVSHIDIAIPRRPSCPPYETSTRLASTVFGPHSARHLHYRDYAQPQFYHPHFGTYVDSPAFNPVGSGRMTNAFDPMMGLFGEMIYARIFRNSMANLYNYSDSYHLEDSWSPRMRRRMMQADKSLSRISFFLLCCVFMCLLSF